ncbi:S-adenosylmethionine decarboxylase [Hydrogenispora ethanolica]|jgi:S-adenosylmethionine decarboxylase|uniref:S-adenosylmethionine decarboxylase proenzyme n=1 Tax=Hydrogenispora ethanolica TaxID=1082276 RepID=A0A4V2QD19_HYDET|nr:adenosylmethionine decarboxylase [Hydrogenispora ethanolica]TCL62087.1 S-adenosylmethionine decarboxylase [Hydrogenispora ethanolica]
METFDTVGAHVLADFWGCRFEKLNDAEFLMNCLRKAASSAKMTVLGEESFKFEPQGFTGLLLLSESHISIHTYPERGFAAIDVYTCGGGMTQKAIEFLKESLEPETVHQMVVRRGLPDEEFAVNAS